ncbi:MAG: hypothetical protein ACRDG4_09625, partial [Chloroflexota bacterium]
YDVLERLHARGLALRQPGDPPRYAAQDYRRFLAEWRASSDQTLDALAAALATIGHALPEHDFWVLRGRQAILHWLRDHIATAQRSVDLLIPAAYAALAANTPRAAHAGRHRIVEPAPNDQSQLVLALIDDYTALAGMLDPEDHCQAVLGGNPALLAVVWTYFAAPQAAASNPIQPAPITQETDWVAWEARKQRRLWTNAGRARSA